MEQKSGGQWKTAQKDNREEEPELKRLEGADCRKLRALWEEVFDGDSKEFTDYYFREKAARNHGYVLQTGGRDAAMLYLSPYPVMLRQGDGFTCREIYYMVGVATKEEYRHKGYMDRLLRASLRDMHEKGRPFTFLMPADCRIYQPYQFAYIYDRVEYRPGKENAHNPMGEENIPRLAEYVQHSLEMRYDVFLRRDADYYRVMAKELAAQHGGICLIQENGAIKGCFLYTREEGQEEIQEAVFDGDGGGTVCGDTGCGGMECPVVPTGRKIPAIMARIVNVRAMLSLLRAKSGETALRIRVHDSLLEENDGIWNCVFSESGAGVCREGEMDAGAAELTAASPGTGCRNAASGGSVMGISGGSVMGISSGSVMGISGGSVIDISVDALASWIFGYRDAGDCFCFEAGAAEREEMLRGLRNIKGWEKVFINEIV